MAGGGLMIGPHEVVPDGFVSAMDLDGKPIVAKGAVVQLVRFRCIHCGKREGLHTSSCGDRPVDPMI